MNGKKRTCATARVQKTPIIKRLHNEEVGKTKSPTTNGTKIHISEAKNKPTNTMSSANYSKEMLKSVYTITISIVYIALQ